MLYLLSLIMGTFNPFFNVHLYDNKMLFKGILKDYHICLKQVQSILFFLIHMYSNADW